MRRAFYKAFDESPEITFWIIFATATALLYMGKINATTWGAIAGGSKVIEDVLRRRGKKKREAQS